MKNFLLACFLLLASNIACFAQCPDDNTLDYSTQSELDDFKTSFPNCLYLRSITLTHSENDPITDLTAFQNIDSLKLDLRISELHELTNLNGLQSLRRLDDLVISNCPLLESTNELQSLTQLDGDIILSNNEVLDDLIGFQQIDSIVQNIRLDGLAGLTNLDGFQNLIKVRSLSITDCSSLESTAQLENLRMVTSNFYIESNENLTNIGSFEILEYVGRNFSISANGMLSNISGFNNLRIVDDGYMELRFNASLQNIEGFNSLTMVNDGNLDLSYNNNLELILGFNSLESIDEELIISNSPSLKKVDGFNSLISSSVDFSFYTDLEEVTGFNNLQSSSGIKFLQNPTLTKIPEFDQLESITGSIQIESNDILENTSGFDNLNSMDGSLRILQNNLLKTLPSFPNLRSLNGIVLRLNPNLESLDGLQLVENLSFLTVDRNDVISSIPNFDLVESMSGSIYIYQNAFLEGIPNFSNLKSTQVFTCRRNLSIEELNGCQELDSIRGSFNINSCDKLKRILGFTKLRTVGSFVITDNEVLESIHSFETLESYSNYYNANSFGISNNPILEKIEGFNFLVGIENLSINKNGIKSIQGFDLFNGDEIEIEENNNLIFIDAFEQAVDSWITIESNPELVSIPSFVSLESAPWIIIKKNNKLPAVDAFNNLRIIKNDLQISENESLELINGFETLDTINGALTLRLNTKLEEISAFNTLTYIHRNLDLIENDSLQRINGFQELEKIYGRYNVFGNNVLKELPPTYKLNEIDGETSSSWGSGTMDISGDSINSLNGLRNLKSIKGYFYITHTNLESLHGLENLDPMIFSTPNIRNNPKLSDCRIAYICEKIPTQQFCNISNNAEGCNNCEEIECLDNYIKGQVFYDHNENKMKDEDEAYLNNVRIIVDPDEAILIPTNDGRFKYFCDEGKNYTVFPELNGLWSITTDSLSYNFNFEMGSEENLNKDFGVIPNFELHSGEIGLISDPTRCNTDVNFTISYKNTGTFEESGEITLHLNSLVTYVQADPAPSVIANDILIWNYSDLKPFRSDNIALILTMPDELSTGSFLQLATEISAEGGILADYTYTPEVICSYDPNDKLVMPVDSTDFNIIQQEQKLTYTIRFQNEGNAEAINIFIQDTLNANLDMSSFRVIDSSFPVLTSIMQNAVRFDFENIWLPAASINEAESHGYITYSILPKPDLTPGSIIENEAFIYFDFNAPIQTNKTVNMIFNPTSVHNISSVDQVNIQPNPANNMILVKSKADIEKIELYSLSGLMLYSGKNDSIDVGEFAPGLYAIRIKTKEYNFIEILSIVR